MAVISSVDASKTGRPSRNEFVELSLLLPAGRVDALVALSRSRGESVAQLLRRWIDEGLEAEEGSL